MLCDDCHERDAVIQLAQVTASGKTMLRLCEQCAAQRGVQTLTKPGNPLGDFLQAVQQQMTSAQTDAIRCGFCGGTLKDFRATGRLGCARCYTSFEASLRELLRRVHGSSRHIGRKYELPSAGEPEKNAVLGDLRDRLRKAIESEQFELAADLRDRIRESE